MSFRRHSSFLRRDSRSIRRPSLLFLKRVQSYLLSPAGVLLSLCTKMFLSDYTNLKEIQIRPAARNARPNDFSNTVWNIFRPLLLF